MRSVIKASIYTSLNTIDILLPSGGCDTEIYDSVTGLEEGL